MCLERVSSVCVRVRKLAALYSRFYAFVCVNVYASTSPRLRMSHLFIIFKAYTCCVLRILATATYKTVV